MIVDGVAFIDEMIVGMSKDEFISRHIDAFWLDLKKSERKKKLEDVYDMIVKPTPVEK